MKAYKKIVYVSELKEENPAPEFKKDPVSQVIKIDGSKEIFKYKSTPAFDKDKIIMKFKGLGRIPCKCVKMFQNQDNSFTLRVNKAKLTKADKGPHSI